MNFDDVISERRSVRHFIDKRVEPEKVEAVLRCAALSPSAKNRQPWYFSVLDGDARRDFARLLCEFAVRKGDAMATQTADVILDAGVLILVFSGSHCPSPSRTDLLSVGGAMYSICLKATDLGLGSLWIGDTDILSDELAEDIGRGVLLGAIALGYPARHYPPRPRKPFAEITDLSSPETKERIYDEITELNLDGAQYAFCSYSHLNADVFTADMVELQHHNAPVWYDKSLALGKPWDDGALARLGAPDCRAMLIYISPESMASEPVATELKAAIARQKSDTDFAIIPIHIGGARLTAIAAESKRLYDSKYTDVFLDYFGKEDRVLYIPRDVYPSSLKHIEKVITALAEANIYKNGRVYENYSYKIVGDSYAVITRYHGFSETVEPPLAISGYPVREIGDGTFSENGYITEAVLPDSVERIGMGAFRKCERLRHVEIPRRVSELGVACFRDCISLPKIELPHGLTVLREAIFRGCTSLKEITVPEGVTELEEAVFRHCHSLERAILPTTLVRMTEGGFYDCPSLVELVIPETVEGLEVQSFDTSPKLRRTVASGFVFEKGTARKI